MARRIAGAVQARTGRTEGIGDEALRRRMRAIEVAVGQSPASDEISPRTPGGISCSQGIEEVQAGHSRWVGRWGGRGHRTPALQWQCAAWTRSRGPSVAAVHVHPGNPLPRPGASTAPRSPGAASRRRDRRASGSPGAARREPPGRPRPRGGRRVGDRGSSRPSRSTRSRSSAWGTSSPRMTMDAPERSGGYISFTRCIEEDGRELGGRPVIGAEREPAGDTEVVIHDCGVAHRYTPSARPWSRRCRSRRPARLPTAHGSPGFQQGVAPPPGSAATAARGEVARAAGAG